MRAAESCNETHERVDVAVTIEYSKTMHWHSHLQRLCSRSTRLRHTRARVYIDLQVTTTIRTDTVRLALGSCRVNTR